MNHHGCFSTVGYRNKRVLHLHFLRYPSADMEGDKKMQPVDEE